MSSLPHNTGICYNGSMPIKKPFLSFVIDPDLLRSVDDFRFERRFSSRAAAILWLIRRALAAEEYDGPREKKG